MHEIHNCVEHLVCIAPPPEQPIEHVSSSQWKIIETDVGVSLPEDYRAIMELYGSGCFNDLFWLFNPVSQSETLNLMNQVNGLTLGQYPHMLEYEEAKSSFPDACPFPSFPKPGGLFPLGGDTNGGHAFWATRDHPSEWALILYPHGFHEFEIYEMPLIDFLVLWLSGKLPDCFFGVGKFFIDRTNPNFR